MRTGYMAQKLTQKIPIEGRIRRGGMKVGEMEHDVVGCIAQFGSPITSATLNAIHDMGSRNATRTFNYNQSGVGRFQGLINTSSRESIINDTDLFFD